MAVVVARPRGREKRQLSPEVEPITLTECLEMGVEGGWRRSHRPGSQRQVAGGKARLGRSRAASEGEGGRCHWLEEQRLPAMAISEQKQGSQGRAPEGRVGAVLRRGWAR